MSIQPNTEHEIKAARAVLVWGVIVASVQVACLVMWWNMSRALIGSIADSRDAAKASLERAIRAEQNHNAAMNQIVPALNMLLQERQTRMQTNLANEIPTTQGSN